ncbi:MAG TPA: divergent polysaccharide deacetylase family protein [Thermoanaerobaculia bacterium]|nr:divergent polysaccharide deacetylase family protein [Thermoanaerobaculia bacterium]
MGTRRRRRRRRRGKTRHVGLGGVAIFFLGAFAALAVVWIALRVGGLKLPGEGEPPAAEAPPAEAAERPSATPAANPASDETPPVYPTEPELPAAEEALAPVEGPPPRAPAAGAYVALVIDDLGRNVGDVGRLAALGVPVTYAVLPFESRTPEVAAELRRRGAEVLLHLPMQGQNGADPGPGALTLEMSEAELRATVRRALAAVPGAVGVNNHMGSVLTADERAMRWVVGEIAPRGLFFLDSRTTADSVGYGLAQGMGVPAAERDVFLDGDLRPEAIRGQFRRLLEEARREGSAVGIGHPHSATLAVLEEEVPAAVEAGYEFVVVSALLDRVGVLPE